MILGCDSLTLRFQMLGSQINMTEPMDHVQLTYDEEKYRPKLIVTGY